MIEITIREYDELGDHQNRILEFPDKRHALEWYELTMKEMESFRDRLLASCVDFTGCSEGGS